MSQVIKFKENPSAGNMGLEKENRSKFPGCYDWIQPAKRNGRWITGLDEYAQDVLSIRDSKIREERQAKIKADRENLESLLGFKLDALSDFWNTYFVKLDPEAQIDLSIPTKKLMYHVIMASDAVAPSIKESMDPEYNHAKYYVFRDFEDVSDRVEKKDRMATAMVELKKLLNKPERAIQIGKYLDLNVSNLTPQENVKDIFYTFIDMDEKLNSVSRFLDAVSKTPEEINIRLIFTEALKLGVIRQRDGLYQRGNITLGKSSSMSEALNFLGDPKNSGELLSIQEEIEVKRKFG